MKEETISKNILIIIIAVALVTLSSIHLTRFFDGNNLPIGASEYYYSSSAEQIKISGLEKTISLSTVPQAMEYNLYTLLIAASPLDVQFAVKIIPLILGLLSAVMFNLFLRDLKISKDEKLISSLIFILSPGFIAAFAYSTPISAALTSIIIAAYYLKKPYPKNLISTIFLILIPMFSISAAITTAILLIIYSLFDLKQLKTSIRLMFVLIISTCVSIFFLNIPLPKILIFEQSLSFNMLNNVISEFGAHYGIGIFVLTLGVLGMIFARRQNSSINKFVIITVLSLIALSFLNSEFSIYLNLLLCIFSGIGFMRLFGTQWEVETIRNFTRLIVICGLLFSTVSYIDSTIDNKPYKEYIKSFDWLKENTGESDIILTNPEYSFWFNTLTGRKTFINNRIEDQNALVDSETLFAGRNLKKTKELLDKRNIRFIWINDAMKNGAIWMSKDEGLLFLLQNNETFKKTYDRDGIQIWEVLTD